MRHLLFLVTIIDNKDSKYVFPYFLSFFFINDNIIIDQGQWYKTSLLSMAQYHNKLECLSPTFSRFIDFFTKETFVSLIETFSFIVENTTIDLISIV